MEKSKKTNYSKAINCNCVRSYRKLFIWDLYLGTIGERAAGSPERVFRTMVKIPYWFESYAFKNKEYRNVIYHEIMRLYFIFDLLSHIQLSFVCGQRRAVKTRKGKRIDIRQDSTQVENIEFLHF